MSVPFELKTWIVMLRDTSATVFASTNPGGVLTRVHRIADTETPARIDQEVAAFLERARCAGDFDRWMLVAPASHIDRVQSAVSPETRALLEATQTADLSSIPPEEMRLHVPHAARL